MIYLVKNCINPIIVGLPKEGHDDKIDLINTFHSKAYKKN